MEHNRQGRRRERNHPGVGEGIKRKMSRVENHFVLPCCKIYFFFLIHCISVIHQCRSAIIVKKIKRHHFVFICVVCGVFLTWIILVVKTGEFSKACPHNLYIIL